ncbi:UNVERIFIED_ORG: hypothetical protein J2W19_000424 [Shinella zoogloeoides]|nr:hypothetical protein [Shinella zoogloeoides]
MTVYTVTRKTQSWYGEQIGILILDAPIPASPAMSAMRRPMIIPFASRR